MATGTARYFIDRSAARRCGDVLRSTAWGETVVIGNAGPCADGSPCRHEPTAHAVREGPFAVVTCARHGPADVAPPKF